MLFLFYSASIIGGARISLKYKTGPSVFPDFWTLAMFLLYFFRLKIGPYTLCLEILHLQVSLGVEVKTLSVIFGNVIKVLFKTHLS